ncbi:MAG TPA: DNA adenine methylase [Chloroflexota bacterium]|nr:DNA adenine methylase [Chloroflexota bacterium]
MIDQAEVPTRARYDPRRHAAIRTDEYVYAQLIPYIGNKRKLLPLISNGIQHTGLEAGTFVDLFSGSTVVARLAKTMGFRVATNDWEPYAHEIARGTVALNRVPEFGALGGPALVFERLNALDPEHGYVARHLCPLDDERPDSTQERLFFTRQNGERIDAMREQIAAWEAAGSISPDERAYLLSALLYAVSYVSNTSGVFKGFHDGWGGQTATALYRIRSLLRLKPPMVFDNGQHNLAWRDDAQSLARDLVQRLGQTPDVVYVDPPYNQHPYGSNYHVLNTVALWDKPLVSPRTRVDGRVRDKSAIRKDWRTERRSPYNAARTALPGFQALIGGLTVRWILVSYSTDGNMPLEGMLRLLAERGDLRVLTRRYKRYRVSTPRMSPKSHNVEFLAVLDTAGKATTSRVEALVEEIKCQEAHGPTGWDFEFSDLAE